MSQGIIPIATGGDGATVRSRLNAALQRLQTKGSGTSRPTDIGAYEDWIDTDTPGAGVVTWYLWDGTADITLGTFNTTTHVWTPAGGTTATAPPQGRLTLTSGVPVLTATVSAAATIYYALYTGNQIPIYNGTAFAMTTFAELSNATAQSATGKAGPAVVANNSNYDLFVWSDAGTIRLTRGPAWTSDTARGVGAGTTELQRVLGIWTNKVAITNGPGANLATYVGTVRSNGTATIDWVPAPAAASGGAEAKLHVFNAHNRVLVDGVSQDSTASWSYTTNTWRSLNNSTTNRVSYIDGLAEVEVAANLAIVFAGTTFNGFGVNRDSTSAAPGIVGDAWNISNGSAFSVSQRLLPSLGYHYLQAMEKNSGGGSSTTYGYGDPTGGSFSSVQTEHLAAQMAL